MPAVRAMLALVAVGFLGTWLTQGPVTAPAPVRPVPTTVTTVAPTTTAPTTTTTTTVPVRAVRASRAQRAPRPTLDDATRQRVIAAIYAYDWDAALMVKVASCESGLNPWARNPRSSATGIFQILGATPGLIEEHVALAHRIWRDRGLSPWNASRHCWS